MKTLVTDATDDISEGKFIASRVVECDVVDGNIVELIHEREVNGGWVLDAKCTGPGGKMMLANVCGDGKYRFTSRALKDVAASHRDPTPDEIATVEQALISNGHK